MSNPRHLYANLLALKQAALDAEAAYHGHKYPGVPNDVAAQIAFDIEERRLMHANMAAEDAYKLALDAHIAASKQAAE